MELIYIRTIYLTHEHDSVTTVHSCLNENMYLKKLKNTSKSKGDYYGNSFIFLRDILNISIKGGEIETKIGIVGIANPFGVIKVGLLPFYNFTFILFI